MLDIWFQNTLCPSKIHALQLSLMESVIFFRVCRAKIGMEMEFSNLLHVRSLRFFSDHVVVFSGQRFQPLLLLNQKNIPIFFCMLSLLAIYFGYDTMLDTLFYIPIKYSILETSLHNELTISSRNKLKHLIIEQVLPKINYCFSR